MPPARPRPLDDSRSETSSTIGNIKERNALLAAAGAGVSKNKRVAANAQHSTLKYTVNGVAPSTTTAVEADPSLPRTDWASITPSILHTYRTAYKLPTPSSYTHPHADLIYTSSRIALRSPSAVLARRRLRDLKHQRRKATVNGISKETSKAKEKEKEKDKEDFTTDPITSEHILKPLSPIHPSSQSNAPSSPSTYYSPASTIPESHIGRQPPASLANTIRKHFNAQQLSEAETVARFAYVVRQSSIPENVRMEGSDGDSEGWWMGSQGREVRRAEGGEVGFRLRFRP